MVFLKTHQAPLNSRVYVHTASCCGNLSPSTPGRVRRKCRNYCFRCLVQHIECMMSASGVRREDLCDSLACNRIRMGIPAVKLEEMPTSRISARSDHDLLCLPLRVRSIELSLRGRKHFARSPPHSTNVNVLVWCQVCLFIGNSPRE